jgi:hypothetical protein
MVLTKLQVQSDFLVNVEVVTGRIFAKCIKPPDVSQPECDLPATCVNVDIERPGQKFPTGDQAQYSVDAVEYFF